jgi:hypothetical protein
MKIEPVKKIDNPNYPTIQKFVESPHLLSKNVPASWLKNKFVITALTAFVLSGGVVINEQGSLKADNQVGNKNMEVKIPEEDIQNMKRKPLDLAPMFASAQFSAVPPCIAVSPPVYISEDDAVELIKEAFNDEGFSFINEKCPVLLIKNNAFNDKYDSSNYGKSYLRVDGIDKDEGLAFEFSKPDIPFRLYENGYFFLKSDNIDDMTDSSDKPINVVFF